MRQSIVFDIVIFYPSTIWMMKHIRNLAEICLKVKCFKMTTCSIEKPPNGCLTSVWPPKTGSEWQSLQKHFLNEILWSIFPMRTVKKLDEFFLFHLVIYFNIVLPLYLANNLHEENWKKVADTGNPMLKLDFY